MPQWEDVQDQLKNHNRDYVYMVLRITEVLAGDQLVLGTPQQPDIVRVLSQCPDIHPVSWLLKAITPVSLDNKIGRAHV